jgi:hypothetical protein
MCGKYYQNPFSYACQCFVVSRSSRQIVCSAAIHFAWDVFESILTTYSRCSWIRNWCTAIFKGPTSMPCTVHSIDDPEIRLEAAQWVMDNPLQLSCLRRDTFREPNQRLSNSYHGAVCMIHFRAHVIPTSTTCRTSRSFGLNSFLPLTERREGTQPIPLTLWYEARAAESRKRDT